MKKSLRDYMNEAFTFLQPESSDEKAFKELPWYIKEAQESVAKRAKNGPVTFNLTLKLPDGKTQRIFHEVIYKDGVEQTVREERHASKDGVEKKLYEKHYIVVDGVMFEEKSLRKVLTSADEVRREQRPEAIVTERAKTFAQKLKSPDLSNEERRIWIEGLASEPAGVENATTEVGVRISPVQTHAQELLRQDNISHAETKDLVARVDQAILGKEGIDAEFARLHHARQVMIAEVKRELTREQNQVPVVASVPPLANNVVQLRTAPAQSPALPNEAVPETSTQTQPIPQEPSKQVAEAPAVKEEKEGPEI